MLEMTVVMVIGMFATGSAFVITLNVVVDGEVTWKQALVDYPIHALLAVAIGMSVPMIPWMRHRRHSRKSAYEMAMLMTLLVIPFVCLALFNVVKGADCGLYCLIGFVAMLALMIYRRDQYGVIVSTERASEKEVRPMAIIGFVVVIFLWIAFAGALLFSQSSIHDSWAWFTDQSLLSQIPLGILFLPWLLGMWVWETSWPLAARGVLIGGLAWANVYTFSPWKSFA